MTDLPATKALAASFIDALNRKDWAAVQRLCSADYIHHAPRVPAANLSAYLETAGRMFQAFPDMTATVEQLIAENEYVAFRYTARGTHEGNFYGIAPTGRAVALRTLGMLRIVGGRIEEGWLEFDSGEIYEQLRGGDDGSSSSRS